MPRKLFRRLLSPMKFWANLRINAYMIHARQTPNMMCLQYIHPAMLRRHSRESFWVFSMISWMVIWRLSGHYWVRIIQTIYERLTDLLRDLEALNEINPSIRLEEDGINSVLVTLEAIRERALSTWNLCSQSIHQLTSTSACRACINALHAELTRLLEVQHAFKVLSYFDILGRTKITIQITRIALGLPIVLEQAFGRQAFTRETARENEKQLFPRHVTRLIKGVDAALEKMERILKWLTMMRSWNMFRCMIDRSILYRVVSRFCLYKGLLALSDYHFTLLCQWRSIAVSISSRL